MRQCLAVVLSSVFVFGQQAPEHVLRLQTVITPEPMFGTRDYVRRRFYKPSTIVNVAGPKGCGSLSSMKSCGWD